MGSIFAVRWRSGMRMAVAAGRGASMGLLVVQGVLAASVSHSPQVGRWCRWLPALRFAL